MTNLDDVMLDAACLALVINDVDLKEIKSEYSRSVLNERIKGLKNFSSNLYQLINKLGEIEEEMRFEENPELLGVHHYPELKEIDFLPEQQKINLDNYLCRLGLNSYIYPQSLAWRKVAGGDGNKIFEFLINKGIIETYYKVSTDEFGENAEILNQSDMALALRYFLYPDGDFTKDQHGRIFDLNLVLNDDEEGISERDIGYASVYGKLYKIIKERDKKWDRI